MQFPPKYWMSPSMLLRPLSGFYMRGLWDSLQRFPPPRSLKRERPAHRDAYAEGVEAAEEYLRVRPWLAEE
jgi:hypothetical protein